MGILLTAGTLGNHPNSLPDLQRGSTVNVSNDAITDWSYAENGVYHGHFTTKVLTAHMPQAIALPSRSDLRVAPA